jgi:hypothetical protein
MKVKGNIQEGDQDQDGNNKLRKMSHRRKEKHGQLLIGEKLCEGGCMKRLCCQMTHIKWKHL